MKQIKNITRWFVDDIMNCADDYDLFEMQMMEEMYLSCLQIIEGEKTNVNVNESSPIQS